MNCFLCKTDCGINVYDNFDCSCDICNKVFCGDCFYNIENVVNLGNGGDYCIECYATVWMGWKNNK